MRRHPVVVRMLHVIVIAEAKKNITIYTTTLPTLLSLLHKEALYPIKQLCSAGRTTSFTQKHIYWTMVIEALNSTPAKRVTLIKQRGDFFSFLIPHCFICHPSNSLY
jgi:hypothetical protein